jgi:hypothetical protein
MDHILWNLSLIPGGLQVALFSASSGSVNPGHTPIALDRSYPFWLGLLTLGIALAGAVRAVADRRGPASLDYRWAALIIVALPSLSIILTEQAWVEYFFPLSFAVMIALGKCVELLTLSWRRAVGIGAAVLGAALVLLIPPYYPAHATGRPIKSAYDRLHPYRALLDAEPGTIILGDYAGEMANWLGLARPHSTVQGYSTDPVPDLCGKLDCRTISAVFVNPRVLGLASDLQFFCPKDPDGRPWFLVGTEAENREGLLLVRQSDAMPVASTACRAP